MVALGTGSGDPVPLAPSRPALVVLGLVQRLWCWVSSGAVVSDLLIRYRRLTNVLAWRSVEVGGVVVFGVRSGSLECCVLDGI